MPENKSKLRKFLIYLSERFKILLIVSVVYAAFLVIYDLLFFKRQAGEILQTYSLALLISVLVWFGFRLVVWVQMKNKLLPNRFLNIFLILAVSAFSIGSVFFGIEYFMSGFIITPFIALSAILTLVRSCKHLE